MPENHLKCLKTILNGWKPSKMPENDLKCLKTILNAWNYFDIVNSEWKRPGLVYFWQLTHALDIHDTILEVVFSFFNYNKQLIITKEKVFIIVREDVIAITKIWENAYMNFIDLYIFVFHVGCKCLYIILVVCICTLLLVIYICI